MNNIQYASISIGRHLNTFHKLVFNVAKKGNLKSNAKFEQLFLVNQGNGDTYFKMEQ